MAGRKLDRVGKSRRRIPKRVVAFDLIWIWLILCVSLFCQPASGEPLPHEPSQWKAGIERTTRGWDYDGKRILGHIGYDICLWDAETGELIHRMKGHKERIYSVQFSPDGHHALSSSWIGPGPMNPIISRDTRTILWNLGTGRERDSFEAQVAGEFSPNGRLIVAFSQRPSEIKPEWGESTLPATGEVWPLGVAGSFDFAVWDAFTGRQLVKAKLEEHSDPKRDTLHFSPDGRNFVRLSDTTAMLYNTNDGREMDSIDVSTILSRFSERHYTSNGALASVDSEKFRLTDIESGRVIHSVPHSLKRTEAFAWTHDGSRVAVLRAGEPVQIWDLESGEATNEADPVIYPRQAAVVSPDNRFLAVFLWNGPERDEPALGIYKMKTGEEIAQAKLPEFAGMVGFSPDSKTLLIGGSEFVIYNAETGEKIRTLAFLDDADVDRWSE